VTLSGGVLDDTGGVITAAMAMNGGSLEIASGKTLALSGAVTLSGGVAIGPGTLSTSGTTTINTNAPSFDGSLAWVNSGTVNDGSGDSINLDYPSGVGAVAITNKSGAVYNLTGDSTPFNIVGGSASFNNAGTLAKTGGTGTSLIALPFTNTGVLTVGTATLAIDDGGSFGGTLSGAGTIAFEGGISTVDSGANTVSNNAVNLDGSLAWVNGGIVNDTTTNAINVDYPSGSGGVVITNKAGAVFNLGTDSTPFSNNGGTPGFSNAGTLAKTGGTLTSNFTLPLINTGVMTVATGTLALTDGATLGGTLNGAGTLAFAGGTETIGSGVTLATAHFLVDGGDLAFTANTSAAALVMSSGSITVASGVTLGQIGRASCRERVLLGV
jgi:hypothetical protein